MSRIAARFAALKDEGRAGFVPFVMAGDPNLAASEAVLAGLPGAGADLIELGVCFTDPMADGIAIQEAGQRALASGQTLVKTLEMVKRFRGQDDVTPIILMGYANPFLAYGVERFVKDADAAGVDGLIIVDLPPEEDAEVCLPARAAGLDFIRLATPTTDAARLPSVLKNASGFVYYVAVAGVTGQKSARGADISGAIDHIRSEAGLPVAVGFGVRTPEQAAEMAGAADAVVVGSALVSTLAEALAQAPDDVDNAVNAVLSLTRDLSTAVRAAKRA